MTVPKILFEFIVGAVQTRVFRTKKWKVDSGKTLIVSARVLDFVCYDLVLMKPEEHT